LRFFNFLPKDPRSQINIYVAKRWTRGTELLH
jgi:hypothetical protein